VAGLPEGSVEGRAGGPGAVVVPWTSGQCSVVWQSLCNQGCPNLLASLENRFNVFLLVFLFALVQSFSIYDLIAVISILNASFMPTGADSHHNARRAKESDVSVVPFRLSRHFRREQCVKRYLNGEPRYPFG